MPCKRKCSDAKKSETNVMLIDAFFCAYALNVILLKYQIYKKKSRPLFPENQITRNYKNVLDYFFGKAKKYLKKCL